MAAWIIIARPRKTGVRVTDATDDIKATAVVYTDEKHVLSFRGIVIEGVHSNIHCAVVLIIVYYGAFQSAKVFLNGTTGTKAKRSLQSRI